MKFDLYQGDCLEVMKGIYKEHGCCIDMVLCDLPYSITSNKWDKMIDLDAMWYMLDFICEETSAKVFTASQPFTSKLVLSNEKEFKHEWIWLKIEAVILQIPYANQ